VLERRLISRATDSLEAIADRVHTASFEMQVAAQLPFDGVIVNDNLSTAFEELKAFINQDRESCEACRAKKRLMKK
jgi:guanylate kinase